jgi:hypothetical protein
VSRRHGEVLVTQARGHDVAADPCLHGQHTDGLSNVSVTSVRRGSSSESDFDTRHEAKGEVLGNATHLDARGVDAVGST